MKFWKKLLRRPVVSAALLYSLFCLLLCAGKGRVLKGLYARLVFEDAEGKLDGAQRTPMPARVLSAEEKSGGRWIRIRFSEGPLTGLRAEGYAEGVLPGDEVLFSGELMRPRRASNPGEFDPLFYYSLRKSAFLFSEASFRVQKEGRGLKRLVYGLRARMSLNIAAGLPEPEAGLLSAILLGEKGRSSQEMKTLFQEAGIGHILAVSGLHVSLFFEAVYGILRKLMSRRRASAAGLGLVWFYVLLTGAAASTLRAALMLSLKLLSGLFYRQEDPAVSLSAAALVILLLQPLYILDAGFQLSFASVIGLRYLSPLFERLYRLPRKLRRIMAPTCAAFTATAPLTLYHFYAICPYSLLLNPIVVPLVSVVFAAGALGCLCGLVSPGLAKFCFGSVYYVLRLYEVLSRLALRLPFARLRPGCPSLLWMAAAYALLYLLVQLFSLPKPGRLRRVRQLKPVLAGLMLALLCYRSPGDEAVFLNVGQGDCIYLSWRGQDYLIDAGPAYERVIRPFLDYRGAGRLEAVFLSHPDEDHMQGLRALFEEGEIRVRTLVLADHSLQENPARQALIELAHSRGTRIVYWQRGDGLRKGRSEILCLSPEKNDNFLSENDSSMVLLWKTRGHRSLFTGDMESAGEEVLLRRLAERGLSPRAELLKVAHHGSSGASSAPFLEAVSARVSVISAQHSVYGHPHEALLERLRTARSRIFITEQHGAVRVRFGLRIRYDSYYAKEPSS